MTNSLLVSASSASLSSEAWERAKSPALVMRLNCLCSSDWPAAFDKNAKDCVRTKANGTDNRRLYIPTTLGVGYSLMPSIAPTRVAVGARYSMASVPKNRRVVASAWLSGPARSAQRCHSPLISNPRYSCSDEQQTFAD